jgi:glycosyltransferase involved in cell wall biosynthesis
LRVLQFGRFWNDEHGGIERHVYLLSKGLAARGVDVVNVVASANLQGHDEQTVGFRLIQAPSFGVAFRTAMSPALIWRALQLHRTKPFDLFHLHLQDPLSHLASLLLPRDIPRIVTWHHDIVRQKRLLKLYLPLLQNEIRRSSALVAATPAHFGTSSQIPNDFPAGRRHAIPYGMDFGILQLSTRTASLRDSLRQQTGNRRLIFALGRHVSYKGFDVLIQAMQGLDAVLVLGGSGPLTAQLQLQASTLGLNKRVIFAGRIPDENLAAYFHACDVFCLPSVTQMEAFGLVQLEAMACGKPVVCTQLRNGVNVVNRDGETGLAVPPGNPKALALALGHLLSNDDLRQRLGEAGRERAHGIYSLDAMVSSHLRLYEHAVSTRR